MYQKSARAEISAPGSGPTGLNFLGRPGIKARNSNRARPVGWEKLLDQAIQVKLN